LVQNSLDLILEEGVGKATAARWKGAPRTTVCFQFLYVFEAEGPETLGLARYLPTETAVLTGDLAGTVEEGSRLPGSGDIPERELERLSADVVETLLTRTADLRPELKKRTQALLTAKSEQLKKRALESAKDFFDREEARLAHLSAESGPTELTEQAREELLRQKQGVLESLEGAEWRFDAVRMILCQE
jgi:hypothetical protein